MARRLSKKKISGWLLLIAVICFFRCGCHQKMASGVKSLVNDMTAEKPEKMVPQDIPVDQELVARVDSFVKANMPSGSLGVYIYDETAGKEVYACHPDSLLRPASNMKMLTCIAALRRLGPNCRFESGAYVAGRVNAGVVEGDIAMKFTYDPQFNTEKLHRLAESFQRKGIRGVKGRVVIDLAITEPMQHEQHWTMGDLKTRKLGLLYKGQTRVLSEVKYALRSHGVSFLESQVVVTKLPKGAEKIGKTSSHIYFPLFRAMQNSSNEMAECLGYALGAKYADRYGHREAGCEVLRAFVERELNYSCDYVCQIHDPSGLCVNDRMSARFLVILMHYARNHEYIYDMLRRCLPIAGKTGTLHDRLRKPATLGKIQAKTGTLTRENGITSLSGFAEASNGHQLVFGIIQNNLPVADARLWQDRFCAQLTK